MKNEILSTENEIKGKIHTIRGLQVMLDIDLSNIYNVGTRVLNHAVKRNITRFPIDFMFQLTDEEMKNWKSQIVMTNKKNEIKFIYIIPDKVDRTN